MFKQIRNRILRLNMVMVSTVVIVAFAFIFITTYTRMQNDNREKLLKDDAVNLIISGNLRQDRIQHAQPLPEGPFVSGFATRIAPDAGLSFSLLVDSEANVVDINSMVDLQPATYIQAATQAKNASGGIETLTLEGRTWQFLDSPITVFYSEATDLPPSPDSLNSFLAVSVELSNIRFLDVTDSYQMIQSLALMLIVLTVVVLTVFFFISRYFANRAISPMQEAWEKQNRFVVDASHELKTPLSIITANCGVLYAGKEEPVETQIKWVDNIMRATDRMTGLVGGLLSLAGMEETQPRLENSYFNPGKEVASVITEMEATALGKGVLIHKELETDLEIEGNKELIRQILTILLDNAIKYSNSNDDVLVSLKREKKRIIFTVRNNGEGIPPEDLPHIFDRFYRSDPARSSDNGGYGLGLSIAQAIAKQLGAKLSAKSVQGEYAEFRLELEAMPLKKAFYS